MEPQGFGSGGGFGSEGFGSSQIGGVDNAISLDTITGLEELAKENGYKESKVFNAIRATGRVLNFGTASVAGAVRGALMGEGVIKGVRQGQKENIGFAEVYNDIFGRADTRGEKVAVGIGGFAADVLFDPLTYLTFGVSAGLKVTGRTLTKQGTKLAQSTQKNVLESTYDLLRREGFSDGKAKRVSQTVSQRVTNDLWDQAFSKKGLDINKVTAQTRLRAEEQLGRKLTVAEADKFLEGALKTKDLDVIKQVGTKLIDQGGVKFFGQTLVKSETLKNTAVGRAAKRLGQSEIAVAVKNTLGKLFVAGYGQNKQVQEILGRARLASRRAFVGINKEVDNLFKDFNEVELAEFFNAVFDKRLEVLGATKEIQDDAMKQLNKAFPKLNLKNREDALRIYESLDEIHHKQIAKMHKEMEKISKEFFQARQRDIAEGAKIDGSEALESGAAGSFAKIDRLNERFKEAKAALRAMRNEAGSSAKKKSVDDITVEMTDDNVIGLANKLVRIEEERLTEEIDRVLNQLAKIKEEGLGFVQKGQKAKKATQVEMLMQLDEMVKKLEREYVVKSRNLVKIINAKRSAKARQANEKLQFLKSDGAPNDKMNKVAEKLFEGEGAIIRKLAREAGISEEDAFKFYLPSKFRDQVKVKEFAMGRYMSSPSMGFKEDFNGVSNEMLIRDASEALKRGKVEVRNAKIKSQAIRSVVNAFGIKQGGKLATELTKEEAARLGVKKISRKTIDGEINAYVPKEIAEELADFMDPGLNVIDDAAKYLGYDWATGLFKGYVTSLFPAFHVRNMIGNQFQQFLAHGVDAFNPRIQKMAADIALGRNMNKTFKTKTGKVMTYKQLKNMIQKETDFLDEGAFGDTELMLQGLQQGKNWNPFSRNNAALQAGRDVGTVLEAQSKLNSVITSVMAGKSIKEGVEIAEQVLFNYGKLTPFERSVMRRLIPFYTFSRKNFELQIAKLATQPGRVAAQIKMIHGAGNIIGEPMSEEDEEGLPNWIKDSLGFKAGANKYGQSTFITGFGLPIEEFLGRMSGEKGFLWNSISNTMTQMNPLVKFPLERGTGVDFFRGRPITEITNGGDLKPILEAMPNDVAEELKTLLNYQEREVNLYVNGQVVGTKTKVTANPYALHWFRNIPSARFTSTAASFTDTEETPHMVLTRFLTGVRGWTIDQEEQKFFNDLDKRQKLQDYLVRMGVIGIKEIPFEKTPPGEQEGSDAFGEGAGFGQ